MKYPPLSYLTTDEQSPSDSSPADAYHWQVRTAHLGDLSRLAEVLIDSFHPPAGIARCFYPLLQLGIYEELRTRLRSTSPNHIFLVAVAPAESPASAEYLAGTVEVTLRSRFSWQQPPAQHPYISNLAVSKSCRRQGVARALLLTCERTAREWGFQDVYLHVLEDNHQARQLYLTAGYQLAQIDPTWISWLMRQPRRLLMQKHLS